MVDHEQKRLELISRVVIFIPLVVLLLGFLISSNKSSTANLSTAITPTISAQESAVKTKTASSSINLNLTGPYQCQYNDETINANIVIKNKKIRATLISDTVTTNFLVNGDCGYTWEEGTFAGEKMCNIGQYLSMAEMLSSMNLMSLDSILSMVGDLDSSVQLDKNALSSVAQSCKKQEVADEQFILPTTITFSNYQVVTQAPGL